MLAPHCSGLCQLRGHAAAPHNRACCRLSAAQPCVSLGLTSGRQQRCHRLARCMPAASLTVQPGIVQHGLPPTPPQDGSTALHYAAAFGQVSVLRPLVKAGLAVDTTDRAGNTALHLAAGGLQGCAGTCALRWFSAVFHIQAQRVSMSQLLSSRSFREADGISSDSPDACKDKDQDKLGKSSGQRRQVSLPLKISS